MTDIADIDRPIIACRPVELDLANELDLEVARNTIIYTGSVQDECCRCHRKVWLGPRQQAYKAEHPDVEVMDFRCGVMVLTEPQITSVEINSLEDFGGEIISLGNPEGEGVDPDVA